LSEVEIEIEGDKPEESPAAKTPGPRRAKRPKSLTQLASLYQPRF
jgi:hypothetical protein